MAEDQIYLTTGKDPKGKGLLAIMSRGQFQLGDKRVEVLSVAVVPDVKAAKEWFNRMKIEQPWEGRQ